MARTKTTSWSDDPARIEKNGDHLATMETTPPKKGAVPRIELPALDIRAIRIRLIGDSSLICHKWSEKAKKEMRDKQMGNPSAGKEPKNPQQDFIDSLYPHPDGGYGFPTIAFKNAAVSACTSLGKSVTKVQARQAFHVNGELARIEGDPQMREDMVKLPSGNGTADIRYRGEFMPWATTVEIRYNARVLTDAQIINLFNTAGFAVGIGEWRSEKDGGHGLFHVARKGE